MQGSDLSLVFLVRFATHFDEVSNHVHEVSDDHAAEDLDDRHKKPFIVI